MIRVKPDNYSITLKRIAEENRWKRIEEEWIDDVVDDIFTPTQLEHPDELVDGIEWEDF